VARFLRLEAEARREKGTALAVLQPATTLVGQQREKQVALIGEATEHPPRLLDDAPEIAGEGRHLFIAIPPEREGVRLAAGGKGEASVIRPTLHR
jgi:hypothetical protein